MEIMQPIGNADHDIVLTECSISLKRLKKPPRDIHQINTANWDKIIKDIQEITEKIKTKYENRSSNELWSIFKENLIKRMELTYQTRGFQEPESLTWLNFAF